MSIFQSTFTSRPGIGTIGELYTLGLDPYVSAKVARGLVKAGYGVFKASSIGGSGSNMLDPGEVYHIPSPAAAADVDAIIATIGSTAGVQTLSGASLDGVVGTGTMQPARQITLVLSNHTDWDATNATLTGVNHLGQTVSETLAIPDGGNATVTSTGFYRSITSLAIPAQTGTGGTATLGISALTTLTADLFRGVARRQPVKVTPNSSALYGYPGLSSTLVSADYIDGEMVPVLSKGAIWVFTEEVVSDMDKVFVRIAAGAGGSVLGAFRNDDDTSTCVEVPNARFIRDSAAGLAPALFNNAR